jgi:hypothetical protein
MINGFFPSPGVHSPRAPLETEPFLKLFERESLDGRQTAETTAYDPDTWDALSHGVSILYPEKSPSYDSKEGFAV